MENIQKNTPKNIPKNIQGLIADIGGTNARFALISDGEISNDIILKCDSYNSMERAIEVYLEQVGLKSAPDRFSLAIAGPVRGDMVQMTNHPWRFSQRELKEKFSLNYFNVMNDFEAVAFSIADMQDKYLENIGGVECGAVDINQNKIVMGPGTGLGAASLIARRHSTGYRVVGGEGGHVTMPARTEREFKIIEYLQSHKYSHVSVERVCSGKGLLNLYDAIRALDNKMNLPALFPEQITEQAMSGSCEVCVECLELMVRFLARISANMALSINAYGGVYIAGGIAPQLLGYIKQSDFRKEFESKGNFSEYMKAIPSYVVTHPYPAFEGLKGDILSSNS